MSDTEKKPPGLIWRTRRNGAQVAYWAARKDLIKRGYEPKIVRLNYAAGDPQLAARCHVLQAEMLTWAAGKYQGRREAFDGTFGSLARYYETHADSPYHDLQATTQRTYSKTLRLLMANKGDRMVAAVDGADVKRWYKEIAAATSKGWAYYSINVLKAVLSFGATKRLTECTILREELRNARFAAGPRRVEYLTYAQIKAFCGAAHELGLGWMALCFTLQFDLGLRRRDVIGEWVNDSVGTDGIRNGKRIWRDGLTWAHIDGQGVIRKLVSKTKFTSELVAVHAIADYPDVEHELALIPSERRIGPIVLGKRGLPPTEAQCRRYFRMIADKAGIPSNVCMMDARASANTEALAAGADQDERMALLTHTQPQTNQGYVRDLAAPSHRAAAKRVASRKE